MCAGITKLSMLTAAGIATVSTASEKPNIIYILADDMGIGDVGCYGQTIIATPTIDSLAASGIRFTHHYSGSTVSAPSRCALLTGKHTGNASVRGNAGAQHTQDPFYDIPLPAEDLTIAEILQQQGYTTACVGKWGLGGMNTGGHPNKQGFDYFFGYLSQTAAHTYYPDFLYENTSKVKLNQQVYSDEIITAKALDFIDSSRQPFFLFYSSTLPHAPLDIPDNEIDRYNFIVEKQPFEGAYYKAQSRPRAAYAAMVSRFDRNIRQLVNLLHQKGIVDNTLILISSDNGVHRVGGHDPEYFASNGGFRGYKRDLYEGGIRTPMIAVWPFRITQPGVSNHVSAFWDFLPTICELIEYKEPYSTDGISFLPSLTGKGKQRKHKSLYWEFHEHSGAQAIIKDDWKLVKLNAHDPPRSLFELYHLSEDSSESNNVVAKYPLKVRLLKHKLNKTHSFNSVFPFDYEMNM